MRVSLRAFGIIIAVFALLAVPFHATAKPPMDLSAPAKKKVVVAADGSGQFRTVQEAIDSAPDGNLRIEIKPGEYRALISITANGVELRGLGKKPEDTVLVYDNDDLNDPYRRIAVFEAGAVTELAAELPAWLRNILP